MHERISVNNLCFPAASLAEDVATWRSLDARQVGVVAGKLEAEGSDASIALLQDAGLPVATMVHLFMTTGSLADAALVAEAQSRLAQTITAARAIGARTIYMLSGGRGALGWDEASAVFADAIAPCREQARAGGIELLIEPATPLYADMHMAHTLGDVIDLAERADIGVCLDIFSSWTDRRLGELIKKAMPRCHLVQVSDYVRGDRSFPCRAVPGDGVIPLERIIGDILEAGYEGAFDLELIGPRIESEGSYRAVARTGDRLGELLVRLGA